jgi:hypothetical protein
LAEALEAHQDGHYRAVCRLANDFINPDAADINAE